MEKMMRTALAAAVLVALPLVASATTFQFNASLNGANQVPPNAATGTGLASLFYNDLNTVSTSDDTYTFLLLATGLTSAATGFHLHLGAAGTNGSVIVPLTAAFNMGGTVLVNFSDAPTPDSSFLTNLNASNIYVNIHTPTFPGGEIRGQLIPTAAVPEPATYAMFGLGLGLVGMFSRRRASKTRT